MARVIPTQPFQVAVLTLGQNLTPGQRTFVDMSKLQPFINVGNKSMLARLEFKMAMSYTGIAANPVLNSLFFKYMLNKELIGPGNYKITQDRRGWIDPIWQYAQRGEVDWVRGTDIPAGSLSGQRTWTQMLDFEEPLLKSQIARMYPLEAFRAPNAGLFVTLNTAANGLVTIKNCALTVTALTITIIAHVFDVKAAAVPIPIPISEFWLDTNQGDVNPSPGPGMYLRLLMARSPVPTDMTDQAYGAGAPYTSDDLTPYTQFDYFGYAGRYAVYNEAADHLQQRTMKDITTEKHSTVNVVSGNKSEFRIFDPLENFDGLWRGVPLIYPAKNSDILQSPIFQDYPRLGANGGSRVGLPGDFWWLAQRVDPRSDTMLNSLVGALTSVSSQKSILGRKANVNPGHKGADPSRAPLTIDCR